MIGLYDQAKQFWKSLPRKTVVSLCGRRVVVKRPSWHRFLRFCRNFIDRGNIAKRNPDLEPTDVFLVWVRNLCDYADLDYDCVLGESTMPEVSHAIEKVFDPVLQFFLKWVSKDGH